MSFSALVRHFISSFSLILRLARVPPDGGGTHSRRARASPALLEMLPQAALFMFGRQLP